MKKKISIITPVYNEEENILIYYQEVTKELKKYRDKYDFEIIIIDNKSTDSSFQVLKKLKDKDKDKELKIYKLSKNYGYQRSIWTGLCQSSGDASIILDCDLQDPVELFQDFIKNWEKGDQIVYGIRNNRQENYFISSLRKIFYKLINKFSENHLPLNAGDFMLIDKIIIDYIKNINEHDIYLRGIIFGFGFNRSGVKYERKKRLKGKSKFNFSNLLIFAINSFLNEGVFPLRIATIFGLVLFLVSVLLIIFYIIAKIMSLFYFPPGFATILVALLISTAINGIFIGILGEYIARIQKKTRNLPITTIQEKYE